MTSTQSNKEAALKAIDALKEIEERCSENIDALRENLRFRDR